MPVTPGFFATARTPRMLGMLALLLAAALVCGRLGAWQLDRAQERGAQAAARERAELDAAGAQPLAEVLPVSTPMTGAQAGRAVTATGTFDRDGQLLVAGRVADNERGYIVLTPLRIDGGVVAVARGWVADPADAELPPDGTVVVHGWLEPGEQAGSAIRDGIADAISPAQLVNEWNGPIYSGYIVATDDTGPRPLDRPEPDGGGLNLQNLLYAAEWFVFAACAVLLWIRMVRDAARAETHS